MFSTVVLVEMGVTTCSSEWLPLSSRALKPPQVLSLRLTYVCLFSSALEHTSQVTLSQYQREAEQSNVALQREEDRVEQKSAEVGELQRRLLGMETVMVMFGAEMDPRLLFPVAQ